MRRHSLSLAVLIVLGSLSSAQSGEGRDVAEGWRTWASNLAVAGLTVSVGAVREEDGGRTTVVEDVSIAFNLGGLVSGEAGPALQQSTSSLLVHFPEVRFGDLRRADGGATAASITIPSAMTRWEAPAVLPASRQIAEYELHALAIEDSFLPTLPAIDNDPSRPFSRFEPLFRAFLKLSSKRLTIGSIDLRSSASGVKSHATYGAVVAEDIREGTIQRISQDGIQMDLVADPSDTASSDTPKISPLRITFGPFIATHYSIAPIVFFLFDDEISAGDAGLVTRELEQSGFTVAGKDFQFKVGGILASDMRMSGASGDLAKQIDASLLSAGDALSAIRTELDLNLQILQATSLKSLSIDGIKIDTPAAVTSIDSIEFEKLSKYGIKSIVLRDLSTSNTPNAPLAKFHIQQISFDDFAFPAKDAFLHVMRLAEAEPDGQVPQEPPVRAILDMLPMFGSFRIDNYSFALPGGTSARFDRFSLTMRDPIPPIPTAISAGIVGMELPASVSAPPMTTFLAEAAIDTLRIDARFEAEWSEESSTLEVAPLTVSVAGLGTLDMKLHLSGIPRSVFENPQTLPTAVPTMMVEGFEASFGNAPKLAGPLEAQARQQSLSVGDMIRSLGATVREQAAPQTGEPFATMAASAFEEFLTGPTGSLELVARPAQPVPLVQVVGAATMAPGSLVKLLNAVVEYRP